MPSPTLRQPTDRAELYRWHERMLRFLAENRMEDFTSASRVAHDWDLSEMPPIVEGEPQCGYFKAKTRRYALLVPAKIFMLSVVGEDGELVEPERLVCEIGDERTDVFDAWMRLCVRPISAAEYSYLMAVRDWARQSAPDQPQHPRNDGKPVDWMTAKLPPVPAQATTQSKRKTRR